MSAVRNLEQRVRRRFGPLPPDQYQRIAGDLRRLVKRGLAATDDLSRMALDASLDPSLRATAVWFLARLLPKRVSAPVLLGLLTDSPSAVRGEAARALGVIRSKRALPALIDLALHERDPVVRELSLEGLGLLRDERALDALLAIARNPQETSHLRAVAIEQLGVLGSSRPGVLQALEALLADEDPEVAFWALYALGEVGTPAVLPALERAAEADGRTIAPFGTLRDEARRAAAMIRGRQRSARTTRRPQP